MSLAKTENKLKELSQERTAIRQAIQKTGLSPESRNLLKRLKGIEKILLTEAHKHASEFPVCQG